MGEVGCGFFVSGGMARGYEKQPVTGEDRRKVLLFAMNCGGGRGSGRATAFSVKLGLGGPSLSRPGER